MQCRHCGSIIRDNVKYCTMCGKSVFEIRNSIINNETTDKMKEQVINVGNKVADNVKNVSSKVSENIKNIDTDKMKEQFKNVSNNVVENVKNFDKEEAKQKTMNFANNVKTDVKNFKTLSTTKKRNYIIALVVIILVVFVAGKGIMGIGSNSNVKVSKEQLANSMVQKNEAGTQPFLTFAEMRLKEELKYLDRNKTYLFSSNYKIVGNTINFYIVIPETTSYGYNIYGYKASYTITDNTAKYMQKHINSNYTDIRVDKMFKITNEQTISKVETTKDAYKDVVQHAIIPQLEDILNRKP